MIWQDQQRQAQPDERLVKAKRVLGIAARLAVYAAIFAALYSLAPAESLLDRSLGSIKLGEILTWVGYLGITMLFVNALFNPDERARESWEQIGIGLLAMMLPVLVIVGTWLLLPKL